MSRGRFVAIVGGAALILGACAQPKVYVTSAPRPLKKVAVLPMVNETTDLDGPGLVRGMIYNLLAARGWQLIPLAEIDAKLKDHGFSDGGQLKAAKAQDVGQWIGADTLLYSNLTDFNYINVGFYWQRKVRVVGRLVDAATGERLWEADRAWQTQQVVADRRAAGYQFGSQLAAKALEKMTHHPLQAEARIAVERLIITIPNY